MTESSVGIEALQKELEEVKKTSTNARNLQYTLIIFQIATLGVQVIALLKLLLR